MEVVTAVFLNSQKSSPFTSIVKLLPNPNSFSLVALKLCGLTSMAPKKTIEIGLSPEDAAEVKRRFPLYPFRPPYVNETARSQPLGELCLHADYFTCGLMLPIQEPILVFLKHFEMVPAMLTPNTFAVLLGLHKFFSTISLEWNIPNIMSLITMVSKTQGVFYAQVRNGITFALKNCPGYTHGWDRKYAFFKSAAAPWNIPTQVLDVDISVFRGFSVTKEIGELYQAYNQPFFCLDLKTSELSYVKEVKRKPAVGQKRNVADTPDEVNVDEDEDESTEPLVVLRRQPARSSKRTRIEDSPSKGSARLEAPAEVLMLEAAPSNPGAGPSEPEPQIPHSTTDDGKAAEKPSTSYIPIDETFRFCIETAAQEFREFSFDPDTNDMYVYLDDTRRYIPELEMNEVPTMMIENISGLADREALKKMSNKERRHLHNQLAFGACMVSNFISFDSDSRKAAYKHVKKANEVLTTGSNQLAATNLELKTEVENLKKAFEEEKAQHLQSVERLNQLLNLSKDEQASEKASYEKQLLTLSNEVLTLKCSKAQEEREHAKKCAGLEDKCELLRKDLQYIKSDRDKVLLTLKQRPSGPPYAAVPPPPVSVEQIIEQFRGSNEYTRDMSNIGEDAFRILKDALVADGVVSTSVLDQYTYEGCLDRDAKEEFSAPPPL